MALDHSKGKEKRKFGLRHLMFVAIFLWCVYMTVTCNHLKQNKQRWNIETKITSFAGALLILLRSSSPTRPFLISFWGQQQWHTINTEKETRLCHAPQDSNSLADGACAGFCAHMLKLADFGGSLHDRALPIGCGCHSCNTITNLGGHMFIYQRARKGMIKREQFRPCIPQVQRTTFWMHTYEC